MTSTPNKGYALPVVAGNPAVWGTLLNQDLTTIDLNLGGVSTINCAGASNVTVTTAQSSNLILSLTGTLTGNIYLYMPASGGFNFIENNTSGAYTITVQSAGGGLATVIAQGTVVFTFNDTSNQYVIVQSTSTIPSGYLLANISGISAVPSQTTLTALMDNVFGSTQGSILYRGGAGWVVLGPGTSGQVLQTNGVGSNPAWSAVTGVGTVTNIATGTGLTGGPITSSGTVGRDPLYDENMVIWFR